MNLYFFFLFGFTDNNFTVMLPAPIPKIHILLLVLKHFGDGYDLHPQLARIPMETNVDVYSSHG